MSYLNRRQKFYLKWLHRLTLRPSRLPCPACGIEVRRPHQMCVACGSCDSKEHRPCGAY